MDSDVRITERIDDVNHDNERSNTDNKPIDERKSSDGDPSFLSPQQLLLVELTSLDDLSFPTSSTRRIQYTCVSVSRRFLIVGTCTGTVYVFSRYASRHRTKLASLPVSVFTTRDGSVNKLSISSQETHVAVGSESGRVSVASLLSPSPSSNQNTSDVPSTPTLVYTVPGDVRRMDRVTCLCWSPSTQGESLFVGHFSGRLVQHRIGSKSVFRASHEQIHQFDAQIVQICYSNGQLLVSTSSFSYLISLETKQPLQIGRKVRNEAMGACFCGNEGNDQQSAVTSSYIVAARPHGRLWEANLAATVYRTHQFREQNRLVILPIISYRFPLCLDQPSDSQEHIRQLIDFQRLDPLTFDGHQLVASIVGDRCVIADLEGEMREDQNGEEGRSSIQLLSTLGAEIMDYAWNGVDLFVLLAGEGRLRKFTVLTLEKVIERLILKKAFKQAAKLLIQMRVPLNMEVMDQCRNVIEALQSSTHRSAETETLMRSLRKRLSYPAPIGEIERRPSTTRQQSTPTRISPPKPQKTESRIQTRPSSRLPASVAAILSRYSMNGPLKSLNVGIHKVYPASQGSGCIESEGKDKLEGNHEENRDLKSIQPSQGDHNESQSGRERSKSSSPSHHYRKISGLGEEKWMSEDEGRTRTRDFSLKILDQHIVKAKNLLASRESSDPEEVDSLRTLLGLDPFEKPIECVEFIPTVTLASAPRSLAKLAQAVPLEIINKIKVERTSTRPITRLYPRGSRESLSSGGSSSISIASSPLSKGPRIIKTVRPNRGGISVQSTRMPRRVEVRTNIINTENLDNRFDVTTSVQSTKGIIGKTIETSIPVEILQTELKVEVPPPPFQLCQQCSLHRSWMALAVMIPCTGRVHIMDGGVDESVDLSPVPSSPVVWMRLLMDRYHGRASLEYSHLQPCQTCLLSINRLTKIFACGPKDESRAVEMERVRRRALAMSDEHISEIFFGEARQHNNHQQRAEPRSEVRRKALEPTEEGQDLTNPNSQVFLAGISNSLMLAMCACCVGVDELCEWLTRDEWRELVEMISPIEWALLTSVHRFLSTKKTLGPLMPTPSLKAILREYHLSDFIQLDGPGLEKEKSQQKPNSNLSGSKRPVASKPVVVKSWIADMTRNCPLCTLALRTVVGGTDVGVVTYQCGHSFHLVCAQGASSPTATNPSQAHPPPSSSTPLLSSSSPIVPTTCIACRIRNRNAMNNLARR